MTTVLLDPTVVLTAGFLVAVIVVAGALLRAWQGWLDFKRSELERAFAVAFDDDAGVAEVFASHDEALPLLGEWAAAQGRLHLDLHFTGSVDALAALNDRRCLLAGFHALTDAPPFSDNAHSGAQAEITLPRGQARITRRGRHAAVGGQGDA